MSNDTKNELVQNGTTMDHDGDASASDIVVPEISVTP